jgi:hypothetical protein
LLRDPDFIAALSSRADALVDAHTPPPELAGGVRNAFSAAHSNKPPQQTPDAL